MGLFKEGIICVLTDLKNRTDLNGLLCTVRKTNSENNGRIQVTILCDGGEKHILVKRENLRSLEEMSGANNLHAGMAQLELMLKEMSGPNNLHAGMAQLELMNNTTKDAQEMQLKYNSLIQRLEVAITHRNQNRFSIAEENFEKLLSEAEELCGRRSAKVATFLKSFGILRLQQSRWNEAEELLSQADKLRPADSEDNVQGTQTLEYIFSVQVNGRLFKKASNTLVRLKELNHCVRPGIDTSPHELEKTLQKAKSSPAECVVCGRWSILSACGRCNLNVYCSRSCQKTHWKIHKSVCQATSSLNENCKRQYPKLIDDHTSLLEVAKKNNPDILTSSVLRNAMSSKSVTPSCPTEMDNNLLSALSDAKQSYFFCMNEITSSSLLERDGGRRRFLATVGVLSCITIFAWSKSTCANNSLGACFGAHVSIGALLRGLRACERSKIDIDRALHPVLVKLRECFQDFTTQTEIFVTLIGGHRAMDSCDGLKAMFPNEREKWSFAWHIKNCLEEALSRLPVDKVLWNTNLLLRFEGKRIRNMSDEVQVRQKNMNFIIVALDSTTGLIVTHTKYTNMGSLLTESVLNRQQKAYKNSIDPKLSSVSHQEERA